MRAHKKHSGNDRTGVTSNEPGHSHQFECLFRNFVKLAIACSMLICASTGYANLTVQVDRKNITDAELLQVTVRIDNPTAIPSLEWRDLSRDFDVISSSGPNQNRSVRIVNGQQTSENYVQWAVSLRPKRLGMLTLPPLSLGGFASQAIQIQVAQASAAVRQRLNEFVFFDTTVDTAETYVQGQIIYTVKLFYLDSISGEFPPPPPLGDAIVEIIENEKRYDAMLNNRRYYVLEKRYAIYPQSSGRLVIPPETFAGTRGSRGYFSRGQQVVAVSDQHTVEVKPRPASFNGRQWLPAKSLVLSETWATNPPAFVLGEPINRTLILKADGIASSLLPPFENLAIENAKTYEDPANREQVTGARGIQSVLTTTVGIVPTRTGTITLPEISIPWWNTETDKQEIATLPAITFQVAPGIQTTESATVFQPPKQTNSLPLADAGTLPEQVTILTRSNPIWIIISAVSTLLALCMTWMWWITRNRLNALASNPLAKTSATASLNEPALFKTFKDECLRNNAVDARNALFFWAKARYPTINSNRALSGLCEDSTQVGYLTEEILNLETAIYSASPNSHWRGDGLLKLVTALRNQTVESRATTALIAELNPV